MSADPPRKRRSSFSGRLQRVFNIDSTDKRQSHGHDIFQASSRLSSALNDSHDSKLEATATHMGPDETAISSLTISSKSHIPSITTPGSSPSVVHIVPNDEVMTPQPQKPRVDGADISSLSTRGKQSARKERRATKRLEADRKELEKRLLQLEESQSKLNQGMLDRSGRRLTKKQPEGSSSRSSSTGSSRFRSSSIGAFLTGSRRASRANSINNDDTNSPKQAGPTVPPSIPLALPERFGADVSRELSTRHGPMISSSQHTLAKSVSGMSQSSQQLQRSLHAVPKSDDLRENWKMAEEWQKKNSNPELGNADLRRRLEALADAHSQRKGRDSPHMAEASSGLLSANTKTRSRLPSPTKPSTGTSSMADRKSLPIESLSRDLPVKDDVMTDDPTSYCVPVGELRDTSDTMFEKGHSSHAESNESNPPKPDSTSVATSRTQQEATAHAHPRQYKSSPLTMNPHTFEDSDLTTNGNPTSFASQAQVPQPLRIFKPSQSGGSQERRRQATQSWPNATQDESQQMSIALSESPETHQQANGEGKPRRGSMLSPSYSRVIPPRKHPGRRSLDGKAPQGAHEHIRSMSEVPLNSTKSKDNVLSAGAITSEAAAEDLHELEHRPSSSHSSQGASSYDTADEEIIDVLSKRPSENLSEKTAQTSKNRAVPRTETTPSGLLSSSPTHGRKNSLTHGGPLSMLRRKPMQKVKPPRAEDVVAKLFVICCQCKYWHDMPSEVYAKLASPERLPSESRLVRNFSRRNSFRKGIFASDPNDPRRMPLPPRGQPSNNPSSPRDAVGEGHAKAPSQTTPSSPTRCCWCGHSMGKTCCQGWTALVHMRERYH